MELLASGAILLLFGTPGARLVALWHRTREAPEGLLSAFFLGLAVGIPTSLFSITHKTESYIEPMQLVSVVAQIGAKIGLLLFTRQVFRKNAFLGVGCWITVSLFAVCFVILIASGQIKSQMHWTVIVMTLWSIGTVLWALAECVGYYLRMGRQLKMRPGDPVVRNRFLLSAATGITS